MESVKSQTIRSIKWNGIEKFGGQGIQFLVTLIIARMLSPSDYGLIGLLTIFITISQAFIDSGFNTALLRTKSPKEEDFCTVFYFNILIACITYTILFVTAPAISSFFNQSILIDILRVYSITLIINSFMAVQVARLQIRLDFKTLAKLRISAIFISGFVGIAMAYWGCGVWALVGQNLTSSIISVTFISFSCRWYPKYGFSIDSFRRLGAFGSRILVAGLLDSIYRNLTKFAIGKFYTSADLGNYERGAQFAELPNKSINNVLSTVTFPILAKIQDDEQRLIHVYRKYIQISSMLIFIISGLLCALAKPIILFTLTEKWESAIIFLHLFAFSCMFDHLSSINLNLLKVKGRSDLFLRLEIIKKSISLSILLCAIPFGVIFICISSLIYNQIAVFFNTYYTGKLFNYGYIAQIKDFFPYFIKTLISCLPAYLLTFTTLHHLVVIVLGSCISISIYILILQKDENMKELFTILINKLRNQNK